MLGGDLFTTEFKYLFMYSHSFSTITDHIPPRAGTVLYPTDTVTKTHVTSLLVVQLDVFGDFMVMDQEEERML